MQVVAKLQTLKSTLSRPISSFVRTLAYSLAKEIMKEDHFVYGKGQSTVKIAPKESPIGW